MKKRILSLVMAIAMIATMMPMMAFAGDVNTSPMLIAKATSVEDGRIQISWLHYKDANKYVVYGNKYGKTMKKLKTISCDGITSNTSFKVKKIGNKKLKKHEVYRFYVVAKNSTEELSRSNYLICVSGKTTGKNKEFSNATSIDVIHKTVNLEKDSIASAVVIADISSKIYNSKKHLPSKYGNKYRYIIDNPNVLSINSEGLMQVKSTATVGSTATVIVQELNGVYNTFDVKIVNTQEPVKETVVVHDGYYYNGYYYGWWNGYYQPIIRATTINDATSSILARIEAQYETAINAITGIDPDSTAQRTALRTECTSRKNMVSNLKEYVIYNPTPYAYDAYIYEINQIYNTPVGVSLNYNDLLREMLNNM